MSPEGFFSEFLGRFVEAVDARVGAVWLRDGSENLNLLTDVNLKTTGLFETADTPELNQKLLDEAQVKRMRAARLQMPNRTSDEAYAQLDRFLKGSDTERSGERSRNGAKKQA